MKIGDVVEVYVMTKNDFSIQETWVPAIVIEIGNGKFAVQAFKGRHFGDSNNLMWLRNEDKHWTWV